MVALIRRLRFLARGAAQHAMAGHDRLPMPFERARTQLLLGQLQRRQRQKDLSRTTLREALQAFEAMGTPLWAERARTELARAEATHTHVLALTPSELRLAELAASSMTNRDVGAALFISPKTIEGCSSARRRSKQTSHGFTASSASRRGPNWAAASTAANTCGYSACCGGTRANAAKRYRIRGAPRAKSPAGLANLRTCRSQGLYTPANREVT